MLLRPSDDLSVACSFKLELQKCGLLQQVEAVVSSAGEMAQLYWAEAVEFGIEYPLVLQIGDGLDLSLATIRDIFDARERAPNPRRN